MQRPTLIRSIGAATALVFGLLAYTQTAQPQAARPLTTEKVKPNLYRISGDGGNVAAYLTDGGVVLVDDMYDRDFAAIMNEVRKLSGQPVRFVLNTHQHDDHAGGNGPMRNQELAQVVAQENVRTNLAAMGYPDANLPSITFTDHTAIHIGGKTVEMYYFGRGHTGGDSIILFPELKTIHSGDLFLSAGRMFVDYAQGGSALDWPSTLDGALALDFDTVIPGHGPVGGRADVQKWRDDFAKMNQRMQSMVRNGATKAEISKVMDSDYGWPEGGLAIAQVDAFIDELR